MSLVNQKGTHELTWKETFHYFVEGLHNNAKFQILSRKIEKHDDANWKASKLEYCKSRNVHSVQVAQLQNFRNRNNFAVKASIPNFKSKSN